MKSKLFMKIVGIVICCVFLASPAWGGGKKYPKYYPSGSRVSPWTGTYSLNGATVDGAAWDGNQTLITGITYDVAIDFTWTPEGIDYNDLGDPIDNMYVQVHTVSMVINGQTVWSGALVFPMTEFDYNAAYPVPTLTGTVTADLVYTGLITTEGDYEAEVTRTAAGDSYDDVWVLDVTMKNPGSSQVPEPSTMLLLGIGLMGAASWARRRRTDPTR